LPAVRVTPHPLRNVLGEARYAMTNSDKIAIANVVATVLAVLLAPIVALWINGIIQRRANERADKVRILGILLSLRHQLLSADMIRSLNLIDVAFAKDRSVREAWSRYFATLNDGSLNSPTGFAIREEKRRDLILEIARAVGLASHISTADVLRAYGPAFIARQDELAMLEVDIRLADAKKRAQEMNLTGWNPPQQSPPA
jgi:hypothetical protein